MEPWITSPYYKS